LQKITKKWLQEIRFRTTYEIVIHLGRVENSLSHTVEVCRRKLQAIALLIYEKFSWTNSKCLHVFKFSKNNVEVGFTGREISSDNYTPRAFTIIAICELFQKLKKLKNPLP